MLGVQIPDVTDASRYKQVETASLSIAWQQICESGVLGDDHYKRMLYVKVCVVR